MMNFKKSIGLLLITCFFLANVAPAISQAMPETLDQIETNQVILLEQSIDNATLNDSWREQLDEKSRALYDYVSSLTNANTHVNYEIILMFNKQLSSDQKMVLLLMLQVIMRQELNYYKIALSANLLVISLLNLRNGNI
ncbi:MAG: hypothetical protein CfClM3_1352 [Methanobrevibacter sp. CfCl-M3]